MIRDPRSEDTARLDFALDMMRACDRDVFICAEHGRTTWIRKTARLEIERRRGLS